MSEDGTLLLIPAYKPLIGQQPFQITEKAVITHEQTPDLVPDLCESLSSSKFMRNFWCFRQVWN